MGTLVLLVLFLSLAVLLLRKIKLESLFIVHLILYSLSFLRPPAPLYLVTLQVQFAGNSKLELRLLLMEDEALGSEECEQ